MIEYFKERDGESLVIGMRVNGDCYKLALPPEQHHMADRLIERQKSLVRFLLKPNSPVREDERLFPLMRSLGVMA